MECCTIVPHSRWTGRPNEELHTERLERFYTKQLKMLYGEEVPIEVWVSSIVAKDDGRERIAGLMVYGTVDDLLKLKTLGTIAISRYPEELPEEIREIHEKIRRGEPIGRTFHEYNYDIGRNPLDVDEIDNPEWLNGAFGTKYMRSKVNVSEFLVRARHGYSDPLVYVTFCAEIHSPNNTAPATFYDDRSRISASTDAFKKFEIYTPKIWNMMKNGLWHGDIPKQYHDAKNMSRQAIDDFKRHVQNLLENPNNFYSIIQELEAQTVIAR